MKLEIRSNDTLYVDGYVNAVDRFSRVLHGSKGAFIEKVKPNVFKRALAKGNNVKMLLNHDENIVLADTNNGLKLYEDSIGLRVEGLVKNEDVVREARAGHLKGWSFGFTTNQDKWVDGEEGISKRYLEDIDLLEVSLLTITPAYIGTSINTLETRALSDDVVDVVDVVQEEQQEDQEEKRNYLVEIQKVKNWTLEHSI